MDATIKYAFELSLAGMLIVFTSLILIAFAVRLMRAADEKLAAMKEAKAVLDAEPEQNLDNLTLVLISAAAAAVLQHRKYRIKSVRRIITRDARIASWTMEGRSVLHGSHVLNVKTDK